MSLWAEYKREREALSSLEIEGGFITYRIDGEECFIQDLFIRRDLRKTGLGRRLGDEVCRIAREANCTFISATVDSLSGGSTQSMKVLLAYGMELNSVRGSMVIFTKNLEGE